MPHADPVPLVVLAAVLALIAVRQVGAIRLAIWQIMLAGAAAVLLAGSIGPARAASSIDAQVLLFLAGMFVAGEAMVESGYLHHLAGGLFRRARSVGSLVLSVLFVMGLLSALLMNDTVAIIGTPLMLYYADRHRVQPRLLLLALCFAVTLGSVFSPIGNPQNLLIAMHGGLPRPFATFFAWLAAPTLVNILVAYLFLRLFFRKEFHSVPLECPAEPIRDAALARLCRLSLAAAASLACLKAALAMAVPGLDFRLTWIAGAAAAPILVLSPRRMEMIRRMDWHTLVFFASMFVLMASVWDSGALDRLISGMGQARSSGAVMALSVLASQLLSNVPFVALYLPALSGPGASEAALMALAAGSTLAGNLLILGAASNVIVIQNAERRAGVSLTFMDFARVGVPLTLANAAVYWAFFELVL